MSILGYVMTFISVLLIIISIINIVMMFKIKRHGNYLRAKVYDKYKIITLCGSTKFKNEFETIKKELTLRGHIVLNLGCFEKTDGGSYNAYQKRMFEKMHKARIDLSTAIMVVNKDNYIGESTKKEIEYAKATNKEIYYWYN